MYMVRIFLCHFRKMPPEQFRRYSARPIFRQTEIKYRLEKEPRWTHICLCGTTFGRMTWRTERSCWKRNSEGRGSGAPFVVVMKGRAEERTVGRVVDIGRKFRSVTTKKKFPPY
jgi:hypothetical protein